MIFTETPRASTWFQYVCGEAEASSYSLNGCLSSFSVDANVINSWSGLSSCLGVAGCRGAMFALRMGAKNEAGVGQF